MPMVVYTEEEVTAKCDEAVALATADMSERLVIREVEITRLEKELRRAYRCIVGFYQSRRRGELLSDTAVSYHCMTIAAAKRSHLGNGSLEGADYFVGKPVEELHAALSL